MIAGTHPYRIERRRNGIGGADMWPTTPRCASATRTFATIAVLARGTSHPNNAASEPYKTAYLTIVIQDRAWWGKGAVLEIRQKVFDHVIEHCDVEKSSGFVNSRNFPSIFNYKKLGFKHVGTMQRTSSIRPPAPFTTPR